MARTAVTSTSFTGETNGAHPAGFTDLSGGFGQVQVNTLQFGSPFAFDADSSDNGTFANDQYFKFRTSTFGTGANGDVLGGLLRFSGTGATRAGYRVKVTQDNTSSFTVRIVSVTASVETVLATDTSFTFTSSDTLEGEAQGTTIRAMKNGVTILSVTDATYASGKVGLHARAGSLGVFLGDDYEAGDGFLSGGGIVRVNMFYQRKQFFEV